MFIQGLSSHAQAQLGQRFGVFTDKEMEWFRDSVFGVEGQHWFPADIGFQFRADRHGRRVKFGELDIVAVIGTSAMGPVVITVIPHLMHEQTPSAPEPVILVPDEAIELHWERRARTAERKLEELRDAIGVILDFVSPQ